MMTVNAGLPDQADRDRARGALDQTIFLTAGAGAGKTRVLVERICGLVTNVADPIDMDSISAVTFTEKSAAELRDRLRAGLGRQSRSSDPVVAARASGAIRDLDLAAIGTLHSFASRLLSENPIEAGLPPVLDPLDEVAALARTDRWWTELRARLLEDPTTGGALQLLMARGMGLDAVRTMALRLQADWDLVEDRCSTLAPAPVPPIEVGGLRSSLDALIARASDECSDTSDKLYLYLIDLQKWFDDLESAVDDLERMTVLDLVPRPGRKGVKGNWADAASMKAAVQDLVEQVDAVCHRTGRAALHSVLAAVATEVLADAEVRRRAGTLMFHDLLVLSRRMLRRSEVARLAAHRRYRRILLDEFQDTDPLQIEIAVRIVAGPDGGHERWQDCPVPAGSLFLVGDAKQSVYRFRRADIATFLEAQSVLVDGNSSTLSTNFRSHPGVLDWVNRVFGELIVAEPGGQPAYQPLQPDPDRAALHQGAHGPRVLMIGALPVAGDPSAEDVRAQEARRVAAAIAALLREASPVEVREERGWTSRPLRAQDVCMLIPTRTSLTELESQLDAFGIPYRTEASSLIYRSDEVRDLMLTARALDDPTDALALVEALRTPVFACGDDDLVDWRAAGGRFSIFATVPAGIAADHPVAESLGFLKELAHGSSAHAPSELLATIIEQRRLLETATDGPRYRETWRRLRFVVDQARAWTEAERGSLRDFLAWVRRQADEEEKASEIVLPDRDVDAIRILTVHAAKGLEFPVVVLTGMTGKRSNSKANVLWAGDGPPELRLGANRSAGWDAAKDREAWLLHLELLRLMYVAATRAESRLLVSVVRGERKGAMPDDPRRWTRAELLAAASEGATHEVWSTEPAEVPPLEWEATAISPPMLWEKFRALRDRAHSHADLREADSATDIAHRHVPMPTGLGDALDLDLPDGLTKEPRDLELPAWLKGRYGAAVGRAVHATLQTVDLATGKGLDGIAEAQAMAEGVSDQLAAVQALARAGWAAPTVRAAAAREHHREIYVGAQLGGQLVEGYLDLLYRDDDGSLIIADYKTDADPSAETIRAYQRQLLVYAHALAEATGQRIGRGVLVFCRETGAVERAVAFT